MVVKPVNCPRLKTTAQAMLNGQMHCHGGVATRRLHLVLSFSIEEHPTKTATHHGSPPCLQFDQVGHTLDEQYPCS